MPDRVPVLQKLAITAVITASLIGQTTAIGKSPDAATAIYLQVLNDRASDPSDPGVVQRHIVLLQAAGQVAPQLSEATRQLTLATMQIGRNDLARHAARRFLSVSPLHALMQIQAGQLDLLDVETVEAKQQYLQDALQNDETLLPEVKSDMYRQLGELAWQAYGDARAKKYLTLAIKHVPQNLKAQDLLTSIIWADPKADFVERRQRRAAALLATIEANPLSLQTYHDLAVLAGKCGLVDEMHRWRSYWRQAGKRLPGAANLSTQSTLDLADAALAAGAYEESLALLAPMLSPTSTSRPTTQASRPAALPTALEAQVRTSLALLASKLDRPALLDEQEAWFDRQYRDLRAGRTVDADVAAVAAVYYAVYSRTTENRTQRALEFAKSVQSKAATQRGPRLSLPVALAYARAATTQQARAELTKLPTPREPLGALAEAWILIAENKPDLARKALDPVIRRAGPGPARDLLLETWRDLTDHTPPKLDVEPVRTTLEAFNTEYLTVVSNPEQSCSLKLETRGQVGTGEFVRIDLTFTNTGPVDLVIGPTSFIEPIALVEVRLPPDEDARFTLLLPLDARQVLAPGQSLKTYGFLDQARSGDGLSWPDAMITPGVLDNIEHITLQATLNGTVLTDDVHTVPLAQSNEVTLTIAHATGDPVETLLADLHAAKTITWPWANRALRILRDPRHQTRAETVISEILGHMQHATPDTTAAAVYALRAAPPTDKVLNALAAALADNDWLSRLLALDILSEHQRQDAKPLYDHYASRDPNPLVRQLATACLLRHWQKQPTTAPSWP